MVLAFLFIGCLRIQCDFMSCHQKIRILASGSSLQGLVGNQRLTVVRPTLQREVSCQSCLQDEESEGAHRPGRGGCISTMRGMTHICRHSGSPDGLYLLAFCAAEVFSSKIVSILTPLDSTFSELFCTFPCCFILGMLYKGT